MAENGIVPEESLKRPLKIEEEEKPIYPPQSIFPEDSATTKAEKLERNGENGQHLITDEPAAKRVKTEQPEAGEASIKTNGGNKNNGDSRDKVRGIALVKEE